MEQFGQHRQEVGARPGDGGARPDIKVPMVNVQRNKKSPLQSSFPPVTAHETAILR